MYVFAMYDLLTATKRHGVLRYTLRLLYKLAREAYDIPFPPTTTMSYLVRNYLAKSTTLNDADRDVLEHVAGLFDKYTEVPRDYETLYARYKDLPLYFLRSYE